MLAYCIGSGPWWLVCSPRLHHSYDGSVPDLVAFDLPASHSTFALVVDEWDKGNAVALLDQRVSSSIKRSHVAQLQATHLVDPSGRVRLDDGQGVETGDALVVLTSGSTGRPRAVVHTHQSISASVRASAERLKARSTDHWLLCLPPSHVGGFSVFCRAHLGGNDLTVHPSFDADAVVAATKKGVTHVSLVNTALLRIDPSVFEVILLGGSTMPRKLPINVVTTYGLTETMGGVAYDGKPLDGVDIRIVDDEVHVRGPMLMRGYRDEALGDEWLATGDFGEIDDTGRLVVHGRRGNLIVTGGEKVWPHDVEETLLAHPQIADCAVRGVPDDEWGHRVVAWIVPITDDPELDSIRNWVRERLSAVHAPKELRLVTHVPRTALGKVDEPTLLGAPWR